MENYTIQEIKELLEKAIQEQKGISKSSKRNIEAYRFGLQVIKNTPSNQVISVRKNRSNSVNLGDLVEVVSKIYLLNVKNETVGVASSNELDLSRNTMNEIKTAPNVNRRPNPLKELEGFYFISSKGAYYINKSIVTKYWDTFKHTKRGAGFTRKQIHDIIDQEQIRKQKGLSEWLSL